MKQWKFFNGIILLIEITIISLGSFYKHIAFGFGLGDLLWYGLMYLGLLIHLTLTWFGRKKSKNYFIRLSVIFLIFIIWICLEATIWRNSEYRWNGKIFYN